MGELYNRFVELKKQSKKVMLQKPLMPPTL